jgi:hypothetical protein
MPPSAGVITGLSPANACRQLIAAPKTGSVHVSGRTVVTRVEPRSTRRATVAEGGKALVETTVEKLERKTGRFPLAGILMIVGAAGVFLVGLWLGVHPPANAARPDKPDTRGLLLNFTNLLHSLKIPVNFWNLVFLAFGAVTLSGPILDGLFGAILSVFRRNKGSRRTR